MEQIGKDHKACVSFYLEAAKIKGWRAEYKMDCLNKTATESDGTQCCSHFGDHLKETAKTVSRPSPSKMTKRRGRGFHMRLCKTEACHDETKVQLLQRTSTITATNVIQWQNIHVE